MPLQGDTAQGNVHRSNGLDVFAADVADDVTKMIDVQDLAVNLVCANLPAWVCENGPKSVIGVPSSVSGTPLAK